MSDVPATVCVLPRSVPRVRTVRTLLLASAAACVGCDTATDPPTDAGGPHLSHDAGVLLVPDGEVVSVRHTFLLTNPSATETANLVTQSRSCGCTAVTIDPPVVSPGGSAAVTLSYDVSAADGEASNQAVIAGLPGAAAPVELFLLATGASPISIQPAVLRKAVRPGATERIGLTVLTYEMAASLPSAVALRSESPLLRVVESYPLSEGVVAAGDGAKLRTRKTHFVCDLFGDGTNGVRWTGTDMSVPLVAEFGDRSAERTLELRGLPWITPGPPKLLFFNAKPGDERELTLSSDRPFRVTDIRGGNGIVVSVLDSDAPAATEHVLKVRFVGGDEQIRTAETSLVVTTSHPDQPRVSVEVLAFRSEASAEPPR